MSTAADRDEQAELRALREATARSAADVADTLGALATRGRARVRRGRAMIRRLRRPVLLAAPPVVVVIAAGLLLLRRSRAR